MLSLYSGILYLEKFSTAVQATVLPVMGVSQQRHAGTQEPAARAPLRHPNITSISDVAGSTFKAGGGESQVDLHHTLCCANTTGCAVYAAPLLLHCLAGMYRIHPWTPLMT